MQHVQKVANVVKQRYNVNVIIWDDMLRNLMAAEMLPLAKLVEPMVWVYAPDVYQFMPTYNWDKLAEVFETAWTASAFKGAHGPTLTVPPIEKHITNTVAWLNVMKNEATKFNQGKLYTLIVRLFLNYLNTAVDLYFLINSVRRVIFKICL